MMFLSLPYNFLEYRSTPTYNIYNIYTFDIYYIDWGSMLLDFEKIKRGIFWSLIIGIVLFILLSIYSDIHALKNIFIRFDLRRIPLLLILPLLNYLIRYIKWCYYLKVIGVRVPTKENVPIFLSGLAMTITPGKIGEFVKSYFIKESCQVPVSSTMPLVVVERLTDGISMMVLAGIGALSYPHGKGVLAVCFLAAVIGIWIIQTPSLSYRILDALGSLKCLQKIRPAMDNFYENGYLLLKWKPLLFAVAIGVLSWSFEGLAFFFVCEGLGISLPLITCIFVTSFSFILGALSMIPGGLGVTEGSLLGLLTVMGFNKSAATAATLIMRFCTLWFGVGIGLIGLWIAYRNGKNSMCH
jgi:uncharacterized protein (TIRG00374 family)